MPHPALLCRRVNLPDQRCFEFEFLVASKETSQNQVDQADKATNQRDSRIEADHWPVLNFVASILAQVFYKQGLINGHGFIWALDAKHDRVFSSWVWWNVVPRVPTAELTQIKQFEVVEAALIVHELGELPGRFKLVLHVHDECLRGYVVVVPIMWVEVGIEVLGDIDTLDVRQL